MIVALAYSYPEQERVEKLLGWSRAMDDYSNHSLVLGVEKRATKRFMAEALSIFGDVVEFDFVDNMEHFPESKNLAFQQSALFVAQYAPDAKHFLYLESDAVPTTLGWLTAIEGEVRASGKLFVGPLVPAVPTHRSPAHMGSVAVYPVNMIGAGAGEAMIATELPWAAAIAPAVLPRLHQSKLIQDDWEGQGPADGIVLYHPDRDGKILEQLWKGGGVAKPTAAAEDEPAAEASSEVNYLSSEDRAGSNPAPSNPVPAEDDPWENRLESEEQIKHLVSELKKFCTKPAFTSYVRKVLKVQRVVPGGMKKRRRKLT